MRQIGFRRHFLRPADRQAGAQQQRFDALDVFNGELAETVRGFRRHHHARSHRFAVQPYAVAHFGFDGVAVSMAQIQQGAQAAFAFVGGHDLGLQLAAAADTVGQRLHIQRHQRIDVVFQPDEELAIEDDPVFDDFSQARREFTRRQRFQTIQINHHRSGLIESADHVFAERVVDGGLAAHGRIHLRQQRGGHLNEAHAALIARGGKAGQIADNAATERDQRRVAPVRFFQQRRKHLLQHRQRFVLLTIGKDHLIHHDAAPLQHLPDALQIERRQGLVGDQHRLLTRLQRHKRSRIVKQSGGDGNRVAALPKRYSNSLHVALSSLYGAAVVDPRSGGEHKSVFRIGRRRTRKSAISCFPAC